MKFYKEKNFKKIDLNGMIVEISKDWDIIKLEKIANIYAGNCAPQKEEYFKNGKIPFIRMQHLNELYECKYVKKYDLINEKAINNLKLKLFRKNSILVPKSGESIRTEKKAILPFDGYVVNHLAIIEPKIVIDNLFLFYYFLNFKISKLLTKTTTPSINLSTFKKIDVVFPRLHEQKSIAKILSELDQIIDAIDLSIEKYEKIKKYFMKTLLTGKIRVKKENDKFVFIKERDFKKIDLNGMIVEIPEDWDVRKIENVIVDHVAGDWGIDEEKQDLIKCYVIRGTDFFRILNKKFDNIPCRFIKIGKFKEHGVKYKDILIEISGGSNDQPVGRCLIFPNLLGNFYFSNFVRKLYIDKKKIINEYFYYYWNYLYSLGVTKVYENKTTNIRNFKIKEFIMSVKIPIPPINEQKNIAKILRELDQIIELKKRKKERIQNIKKKFMNLLLTGKIRVKMC